MQKGHIQNKGKPSVGRRIARRAKQLLLFVLLILLGLQAYILVAGGLRIIDDSSKKTSEYALVLGTSVQNGQVSEALKARLDQALILYRQRKVNKILCSGDYLGRYYNEVEAMRNYLLDAGIPEEAIVADPMGLSTYDSMWRARNVYEIKSAIICTQRYHTYRSVFLAKSMGIDAWAFPAENTKMADLFALEIREAAARYLAIWEAWVSRPKAQVTSLVPYAFDERSQDLQDLAAEVKKEN